MFFMVNGCLRRRRLHKGIHAGTIGEGGGDEERGERGRESEGALYRRKRVRTSSFHRKRKGKDGREKQEHKVRTKRIFTSLLTNVSVYLLVRVFASKLKTKQYYICKFEARVKRRKVNG